MKFWIIIPCFLYFLNPIQSQVDVMDIVPGDDVRITLNNGGHVEGTAGKQIDNHIQLLSSLNKEYLIHHDSIQNIFSRNHKRFQYIFPGREKFFLELYTKIIVKKHDGQQRIGKFHLVDNEFLHMRLSNGGFLKIELKDIYYIKVLSRHQRNINVYAGLGIYQETFITLNLSSDIKFFDSPNYKALLHVGLGFLGAYGGSATYGRFGLKQCFGSNGKYFEISGNALIGSCVSSEFSMGYRSEKNGFLFRSGFSVIDGEHKGLYISFGF